MNSGSSSTSTVLERGVTKLPELVYSWGLSRRKRSFLRNFLGTIRVRFVESGRDIPADAYLLLWGCTSAPAGTPPNTRIVRMEDGFMRSVGLGADLVQPLSWVLDSRGIYFDATRPSDLEHLLQTGSFTPPLLERAAVLRDRIVEQGITKYNLESSHWQRPTHTQRVLLVPGQVESDASIRFGAPGIATNMGLLQAVREANPDAWIAYKPHPDVQAGLRAKGQNEDQALTWCNEQLQNVAMGELLPQVDEVHTLTSLTGFEALLRGKKVVCYGQPFYAGWGLTFDVLPIERRSRRLTLNELVAGALILYPVYVSRITDRFTTPEQTLNELLQWREQEPAMNSLYVRLKRAILRQIVGVR